MRRLRVVLVIVLALVVLAAALALLVGRPRLSSAQDDVNANWKPVRAALGDRYEKLATFNAAIAGAGASSREVVVDLEDELGQWAQLKGSTEDQVEAANEVEGLAGRLLATVAASPKLATNPDVIAARDAFAAAVVPSGTVNVYNSAVDTYESRRTSIWGEPVTLVFGFHPRTAFEPAESPPPTLSGPPSTTAVP